MAAPIIYSWRDANAPSYFATMASFNALIKACLVDGYTGKAAAGWTIPFEDGTSFIIKQAASDANPTAPQMCLKFHTYHATATSPKVSFEMAEDYTDLNTPVNVVCGDITNDYMSRGEASNTTTYEIPWMIFATTRAVYFWFGYNTSHQGSAPTEFDNEGTLTTQSTFHEFFGDIVHPYPTWLYNQMITYHNGTSYTSTNGANSLTGNLNTGYGRKKIANPGANYVSPDDAYLNFLTKINFSMNYPGMTTLTDGVVKYPNQIDGGLFLDKVRLTSTSSYLGELPGLLYNLGSIAFNKNGIIFSFDGTGDYLGETIYVLSGYSGQLFLRDGDWGVE